MIIPLVIQEGSAEDSNEAVGLSHIPRQNDRPAGVAVLPRASGIIAIIILIHLYLTVIGCALSKRKSKPQDQRRACASKTHLRKGNRIAAWSRVPVSNDREVSR